MKLNSYQRELFDAIVYDYGRGLANFILMQKKPDCCDSFLEHYFNHSMTNDKIHLDYIMKSLQQIEHGVEYFKHFKK